MSVADFTLPMSAADIKGRFSAGPGKKAASLDVFPTILLINRPCPLETPGLLLHPVGAFSP